MSLKNKYSAYTKIIEHNAKALKALSSISEHAGSKEKDSIVKVFLEAMDNIKELVNYYTKIDRTANLNSLLKKIAEVENQAFKPVNSLQTAINFGYEGSGVLKELEEDLFEKVERLTQDFRDPTYKRFDIKNAKTPHDLIRYFHQKGIDSMFRFKSLKKASKHFVSIPMGGNSNKMEVIDLEGKLAKLDCENLNLEELDYKPLKAILDLYNSKNFENPGNEEFKAIVSHEKMIAQIELGCHYSELEARLGNENLIKFIFRDTDFKFYENAKHRSQYVRTVLKKLGFNISCNKNETKAEWKGNDEKKAYKTLQEVVRLAASTSDLDLPSSHINKYPYKAVNAFFKGVTDMGSYLEKCNEEEEKDDKKIKQ